MHVGKDYPFHPTYWATEAWFWPGLAPWKMVVEITGELPFPWSAMAGYSPMLCDAQDFSESGDNTHYAFLGAMTGSGWYLFIYQGKDVEQEDPRAAWLVEFYDEGLGLLASVLHFQPYPQTRVLIEPGEMKWTDGEGAVHALPIRIRPATWAEGGSPYGQT